MAQTGTSKRLAEPGMLIREGHLMEQAGSKGDGLERYCEVRAARPRAKHGEELGQGK